MKTLVVEDDLSSSELYKFVLKDFGLSLCINGDEFLMAYKETYDLFIIDIGLPGRGGIEILELLDRIECPVPIAVITAFDLRGIVLDFPDLKIIKIQKPINRELRNTLLSFIK